MYILVYFAIPAGFALVDNAINNWYSSVTFSFFWPVADDNSGSENLNSSMVILPPTVSDQVLKELFQEGT